MSIREMISVFYDNLNAKFRNGFSEIYLDDSVFDQLLSETFTHGFLDKKSHINEVTINFSQRSVKVVRSK